MKRIANLAVLLAFLTSASAVYASHSKHYSKATATALPTAAGKVYVGAGANKKGSSASATNNCGEKSSNDSQTYCFTAETTNSNYAWDGWYDAETGGNKKSSGTNMQYNESVPAKSTDSNNPTTINRYARWQPKYSIIFNGNGSTSGSMSNLAMVYGTAKNLTANAFVRQYTVTYDAQGGTCSKSSDNVTYSFNKWNTKANGTGTSYGNEANVNNLSSTAGGTVPLYAQWNSASVTLPTATKSGYVLEGWYNGDVNVTSNKVGNPGETYTPTASVTLTAKWTAKFTPEFGGSDQTMYVEAEQTNAFTFTHVDNPTFAINVVSINPINNGDGKVIEYDAANNKMIAHNAGVATITFTQAATASINAGQTTYTYTVNKRPNTLYAHGSETYNPTMNVDGTVSGVTLTATNTDYTGSPISVSESSDTTIATYNKATGVISSHFGLGTATWTISQPENYKYLAGSGSFSATVNKAAEETCYVLDDASEQNWSTIGTSKTYSFSVPGAVLTCQVKRTAILGVSSADNFYAEYSSDGNNWTQKSIGSMSNTDQWYSKSFNLPADARYVRFETTTGAVGKKQVRNVKVSRKTWLTAKDVTITKTAGNNPIYTSGDPGIGLDTIDYSIVNGGDLKIVSDNPKFTVSPTTISASDCSNGTQAITISYSSDVVGNDVGHVLIYNKVYRKEIQVTGVTVKHDQTGSWKENISILTHGTEVENAYSSTLSGSYGVTYTVLSGSAITISEGKLVASAVGTSEVRAYVAGDDDYNDISDTLSITVTDDKVQYIVWEQTELKHLKIGDANVTLTAEAQSDVEGCTSNGSRPITYSIKGGGTTVVEIVNGNELKINGAGKAVVIASQAGGWDSDDHKYIAASTERQVVVRDPSAGCDSTWVYEQSGEHKFDLGTISASTQEQEISFGGKEPGYYSFDYKGEKRKGIFDEYYDGTMTVEQYYDGSWHEVQSLGKPTVGSYKSTGVKALNRKAEKMRVKVTNGKGYQYFKDLQVSLATYIEVKESGTLTNNLAYSTNVGSTQDKTIALHYSNLSGPISLTLSEGAPFALSTDFIDGDCGDKGNQNITLTYQPLAAETNGAHTLTITDGVLTKVINLDATATLRTCVYGNNGDWTTNDNWTNIPNQYSEATIQENKAVTITSHVEVYGLTIEQGASVTIEPQGSLKIGAGGITGATTDNIVLRAATEGEHKGQTAELRVSPEYTGEMPEVKVQLYSKAYYNPATADAKWQYVGSPIEGDTLAKKVFTSSWIYSWDEAQGEWVNNRKNLRFEPFVGYMTTQKVNANGLTLTYKGKLVDTSTPIHVPLVYTPGSPDAGCNVIANSFTAPIDVSRLQTTDFSDGADVTIYLFNTGSDEDVADHASTGAAENLNAAGQYIPMPVLTISTLHSENSDYPVVIPAMQGFYVQTDKACTMTLDYNRLVWNGGHTNQPMRVRAQADDEDETHETAVSGAMHLTLYASTGADHLYLLESEDYQTAYQNGYDARKIMGGAHNIYTIEQEDLLSVDATSSLAGTQIGVRTGSETMYTIAFSRVRTEEGLVLRDIEENTAVEIAEGAEYTFFAAPESHINGRFIIERNEGQDSHGVTTGNEVVADEQAPAVIYNIEGKYMGSQVPAAQGVYIIRRGQKAYKVVR